LQRRALFHVDVNISEIMLFPLQSLKTEAEYSSESPYGITTQKTNTDTFTAMRTLHKGLYSVSMAIRLGDVVVSALTTGPKVRGFEPGQGSGFLKAINIRSTPSFGWEVKPEGAMS
jgi:hypothetical protein